MRDELTLILEPTRAEAGCVRVHLFESMCDPSAFYIHSEWIDEVVFEAHAELPHMRRFLGLADKLLTHPVQAVRTTQIG